MALRQLFQISELCIARHSSLLKHPHLIQLRSQNSVRNFKRIRSEQPKPPDVNNSPFGNIEIHVREVPLNTLWKPLGFTLLFSGTCFGGAVIWHYENMRAHALSMLKRPVGYMQKQVDALGQFRKDLNRWWNQLTPGEKVFVPICFLNVMVFLAWRVPRFQPTMLKYFCSNPGSSSVCWPMLLSTFSHYSFFHLLANMYVLHSFSTGAVATLGKEQFLGLYLSAGVISSFTSHLHKIVTKQPGLSLGASGAIMAILGYVCTQYPETKLGILLLPFLTFSAGSAIKVLVGLDTLGVIMGWKLFDHAAHLGGAACGIAWATWGNEYIWQKRDPILQYWHELRGAIK